MMVDTDALLFSSILGRCAYLAIFTISGFLRRGEQYIFHWAASIALSMIGLLLTSGGHAYTHLGSVRGAIAFTIYGWTIMLCRSGIRLFLGRLVSWGSFAAQAILPGALYGGVACFDRGGSTRALASAFAGLVVITGGTTWELIFAARQERLPSQFLATGALGVYFVIFFASMIFCFIDEEPPSNTRSTYLSLIVDQTCSVLIYIGFLVMAGDRAAARLDRLAMTDPLTGLANRRGLLLLVQKALPSFTRRRQPASVLLVDIDRFKAINDQHGHEGGDLVLTEFAFRCRGVFKRRSDHIIARWGGEEFLIVLCDTPVTDAAQLAEQLRAAIEATTFALDERKIPVTVSIGVAGLLDAGSLDDAIRRADSALYRAKEDGRNRVCVSPQEDRSSMLNQSTPAIQGGKPPTPDMRHSEGFKR